MTKKSQQGLMLAAAATVLLLYPAPAHANIISIFTQNLLLHLFAGNAVIGLVEGALIAWIFKVRASRTILFMIAANYFSTWTGALVLSWLGWQIEEPLVRLVTVNSLHLFIWGLVVVAFVGSVVLEWPFCLAAMWRKPKRVRHSLFACSLVQVLSYTLVLLLNPPLGHFYGSPYGGSRVQVCPASSFSDARNAFVYFISATDNSVCCIRPDGSSLEMMTRVTARQRNTKLMAKPTDDPLRWVLCVEKQFTGREYPPGECTDTGIAVRGFTRFEPDRDAKALDPGDRTRLGEKRAVDLRPEGRKTTKVLTLDLGDTQLQVTPQDTGVTRSGCRLQFDRLILHWTTRNATVLPSGQIVYQLGSQIVLLDVEKRKLGLIALGRGPVVFLDPEPTSRPTATATSITNGSPTSTRADKPPVAPTSVAK